MDKAPHHRREREEYGPVSEICARVYICFTPTEWVPRGAHSVAVKQMWIFKISGEVSNEAVCGHGVTLKSRFLNPL